VEQQRWKTVVERTYSYHHISCSCCLRHILVACLPQRQLDSRVSATELCGLKAKRSTASTTSVRLAAPQPLNSPASQ
jgi:hypothetical protein